MMVVQMPVMVTQSVTAHLPCPTLLPAGYPLQVSTFSGVAFSIAKD